MKGNVLDPTHIDNFKEVLVVTETSGTYTTHTVAENDFDWLDINAVGQQCPIDPLHAYSLFYDDPDAVTPDPANLQVETDCDDASAVDSAGNALPDSCLRDRALHSKMQANKDVITYWPDPDGLFTTDINKVIFEHHHEDGDVTEITLTETVLKLCEPVTVDKWNEGCWIDRYEDVVEVRVVYTDDGSANHGGFHDPAMDGGSPGRR